MEATQHAPSTEGPAPAVPHDIQGVVLRVAWLTLALVLVLELLLLLVAVATGSLHSATPFVVDGVQKLPWSFLLCAALAVGIVAASDHPLTVGLAGLLAAPIASLTARGVVEAAHAMAFTETAPGGPSPLLLAAVKGIEYACLGIAVTILGRRLRAGPVAHLGAGLAAGIVFGGIILAITAQSAPKGLPTEAVLRWAVNELLFPVGCAFILFVTAVEAVELELESEAGATPGAEAQLTHARSG